MNATQFSPSISLKLVRFLLVFLAGTGIAVAQTAPAANSEEPAVKTGVSEKGAAAAGDKTPATKSAPGQMQLEASKIIGSQELPRVMYVLPWKRYEDEDWMSGLDRAPASSVVDEALKPIDYVEFRREVQLYEKSVAAQQPASN